MRINIITWCVFAGSMAVLCHGYAQDQNCNHISIINYLDSTKSERITTIQYYDGLGRLDQTVTGGANTVGTYIYRHVQYDSAERESVKWCPFSASTYTPDYIAVSDIGAESQTTRGYDDFSCSRMTYDALDRISSITTPGAAWANIPQTITYRSNTAADSVRKYLASNPLNYVYYEADRLECKDVVDEEGLHVTIFIDFLGRTILERKSKNTTRLDTYYVYDDHDFLTYVLPPKYSAIESPTQSDLDALAYQYTYNNQGLALTKKLPGAAVIEYGYDMAGKMVRMRDGLLREKGLYRFFMYDRMGRLCVQGTTSTRYDQSYKSDYVSLAISGTGFLGSCYNFSGSLSDLPSSNCSLEIAYYYDDYTFMTLLTSDLDDIDMPSASNSIGCQTGIFQKMNERIITVQKYDCYGRIVQKTDVFPHKYTLSRGYNYNYAGDVICEDFAMNSYTGNGYTIGTGLQKVNSYYPNTRLLQNVELTVTDMTGTQHTNTIQSFTYDSLGNVLEIHRDGALADMEFEYDLIRGWVTGISSEGGFRQRLFRESSLSRPRYDGLITSMTWQIPGETRTRQYDYEYDSANRLREATYSEMATASFNPNPGPAPFPLESSSPAGLGLVPISGISTIEPSESASGIESDLWNIEYGFEYNINKYGEKYDYDENCNITSIERYGAKDNGSFGLIDQLTIDYLGNQRISVEDGVDNLSYYGSSEFVDESSSGAEFIYDSNGNLIGDVNRGIESIEYDNLGHLKKIQFSNSNIIRYTYAVDGTKLQEIHQLATVNASGTTYTNETKNYYGPLIVKTGYPQILQFDGGYATFANGGAFEGWHYYISDYMSNNRMVVCDSIIEQINHYYPYGGIIGDISTNQSFQNYKFEGKELDRTFGLDNYDIQARQYFAMAPSWDRIDPLAEKYYGISPYSYCMGDPVNFGDYNGKNVWKHVIKGAIKVGKTVSKKGVKALNEGATYSQAFSDVVDDFKTMTSSSASLEDKTLAVASLASELLSPISVKDAKTVKRLSNSHISINSERRKGVRNAWKQEKELVEKTGEGSRRWTTDQKKELLKTGKVKGFEGHHTKDVHSNPEMAKDPNNIEFMTRKEHLEDGHDGNWQNPSTDRPQINRIQMIDFYLNTLSNN